MSDYITFKQFNEQSEEVQREFMRWWETNFSETDLCVNRATIIDNIDILKNQHGGLIQLYPLFSEGQLRHFIEGKTEGKIEVLYFHDGYSIRIRNNPKDENIIKSKLGDDLLQVYWQVACKLAVEKKTSSQWQECSLNAAANALFKQECILAINPDGTRKLLKYEEGDLIPVNKSNHIPIVLLDLPNGTKLYRQHEVNSEDGDYDVIGPNDIAP